MSKYVEMTQTISNNDSIILQSSSICSMMTMISMISMITLLSTLSTYVYMLIMEHHGSSRIIIDQSVTPFFEICLTSARVAADAALRASVSWHVMTLQMDPTYPINSLLRFIVLFLLQFYYKKLERLHRNTNCRNADICQLRLAMPVLQTWNLDCVEKTPIYQSQARTQSCRCAFCELLPEPRRNRVCGRHWPQ